MGPASVFRFIKLSNFRVQVYTACHFVRIRIVTRKFRNIDKIYKIASIYLLQEIKT